MSKITKEQLLKSPLPARFIEPGKDLKIVLTREEVEEIKDRTNSVTVILLFHPDDSGRERYWFYTDDYCFGNEITWGDHPSTSFTSVPTSTSIPHMAKERPGVEDGVVRTLEQYELVYRSKGKRIETVDELLQILNQE